MERTSSLENRLLGPIAELLAANPGREWNEHQIIQQLVSQQWVSGEYGRSPLGLFQTHFLVMNALYQLRQTYWQKGVGSLRVSALSIVLTPYGREASSSQLSEEQDAEILARYYLDWRNFARATTTSVKDLLTQFWETYAVSGEQRQALQLLELEVPVTFAEIQRRYRQKAMAWHPDRGGSNDKLAELNGAFETLKRFYKP